MSELTKITLCLLNYRRPQNIPIILKAIRSQTVKSTVFLYNNGSANVNSPLIDRYEQSERNVGCMARWVLAKEAITPYVMSLDDDLCFNRNNALEDIIQSLEKQDNPNRIVGVCGGRFAPILIYEKMKIIECRIADKNHQFRSEPLAQDTAVDIVKGRMMAFRKEILDTISLPKEREDDIFLSATFANKTRKFHRIPVLLNDAFYELPSNYAAWHEPSHLLSRQRALLTYFARNPIFENRFVYQSWKFIRKIKKMFKVR